MPLSTPSNPDLRAHEETLYAISTETSPDEKRFTPGMREHGRPDLFAIVRAAVDATTRESRVLVAAAGPIRFLEDVRLAAGACMTSRNPSLQLHLETFGW